MPPSRHKVETELRHQSTYIVVFQHFFFPDIFFKRLPKLRPAFHCLTTRTCLSDLVCGGHTDFNLNDGRFWLKFGPEVFGKSFVDQLLLHDGDDEYWQFYDSVWKIRTSDQLKNFGHSTDELFGRVYPMSHEVNAPVVPFIGKVNLLRNAIPNCSRTETYETLASIFDCDTRGGVLGYGSMFGLNRKDQSLSHVPIGIGKGKTIHFRDTPFKKLDSVEVVGNTLNVSGQLRVHLYPYGLATSYVILSVSSPHGFVSNQLIELLRKCFAKPNDLNNAVSCIVDQRFVGSIHQLHKWVKDRISNAMGCGRDQGVHSSQIRSVICLNAENSTFVSGKGVPGEIIGIMMRDIHWRKFSERFLRSYRSVFGKYDGEYAVSSGDTLLLSFGARWMEYAKKKSRVRFYWGLLSIFEFIQARKFLCGLLAEYTRTSSEYTSVRMVQMDEYRNLRIMEWLDNLQIQHKLLHSPRRKFYYDLSKTLRLATVEDKLEQVALEALNLTDKLRFNANLIPAKLVQPIHFEDFDGRQFERLVFAYHLRTARWQTLEWYGQVGSDLGRDLWGTKVHLAELETTCIQCVNRKVITANKAIRDIDKVLSSPNGKPSVFKLICAGSVSAALRDKVKSYAKAKGIVACDIWSGQEFEERLRLNCEDLLKRFTEGITFPDNPQRLSTFITKTSPASEKRATRQKLH